MLKEDNLPIFNPTIYTQIALNDLVIYSVHYLHSQEIEITTEDIVATCFLLFPRRFSLRGYPQWPDSTVVNKRWLDCRSKGWITGSAAQGFKLTPDGMKVVEKVEKTLSGKRPTYGVPTEMKTRAGRFVHSIEMSDAFQQFKEKKEATQISEFDFRSMLLCTMESSKATLQKNLEQFKQYINVYEREDLLDFLRYCEKRFSYLLEKSKDRSGGMISKPKGKL
jgi:hypothetical protein